MHCVRNATFIVFIWSLLSIVLCSVFEMSLLSYLSGLYYVLHCATFICFLKGICDFLYSFRTVCESVRKQFHQQFQRHLKMTNVDRRMQRAYTSVAEVILKLKTFKGF
jgi:hypothetical protein